MFKWLDKLVDSNEKVLKRLQPVVDEINSLEPEFEKLSNDELKAKTNEFKQRLQSGEDLDDLLIEAFAAVREAAKRTIDERAFEVQIIGEAPPGPHVDPTIGQALHGSVEVLVGAETIILFFSVSFF